MTSDFASEYQRKLTTAAGAVGLVNDGATIIHGMTLAEPPALLEALTERARAGEVSGLRVYSFNPQATAARTYLNVDVCDRIEAFSWFISAAARGQAAAGLIQFVPCYLHQVPRFIREQMTVDVTMTTVSPMDRAGYFSFGTANDFTSVAAREAGTLLVEVNENMPRVFGDSLIHISEVDAIVENHRPMPEIPAPQPKPEDEAAGRAMAELIPDGAVLQLGIGSLPNAICPYLRDHRDLGIHSELFGPGMADLVRQGVITGRRKSLHQYKHVFSLAYGTRDTFDLMHDNPSMESYPSSYVMDPAVVARNDRMVAVNSILEIDLTGQCNAESLDGTQYSGTGGQLDFVRGAYAAKDGISIMAFYATAKGGSISRVVPRLKEGTAVTTPRMDVQYVATEHGIVNLKQRSVRERALALISIAAPQFRDDLLREAEDMGLM